ncbi:DUF3006 domain-containing protein [Listeria fleischmannii]|jgi:hypothetical protein|uniref:Uncharacterized protein n=2 Tax=Listeria fleischmannii TaxID=1069827 RepID=W7DN45_9LIST|nr:DUF3006 domain-containing protein [Listeria fleischmannii]EIA19900.1 hypothetical protein KKC_09877 [Listeria fleischmannii subsp. coloradonensis]EUJ58989.1 hypothetical protein MCOL2_07047 [Listeria fleischmannii FSL S10-1203]MBC1398875.1 DUF3006 domain-containing protein [Listeria fleischmannii]MBC1419813.1 DUF3006 domain-containing protein [Listeria fleischmannii]MBC1427128.1 DUF3006 domain-containing protein [Listeria fleischmannii]
MEAVLDRIEDGIAVFIIKPTEEEIEMPQSKLPAHLKEGDLVSISSDGTITKNEVATDDAKARIAAKLERLRKQNGR